MDRSLKNILIGTAFGVTLLVGLLRLESLLAAAGQIMAIFRPVFVGGALAFVLNVPMRGIEGLLQAAFARTRFARRPGALRPLALALTLVLVGAVFALLGWTLIPQLVSSVNTIRTLVSQLFPIWMAWLQEWQIDTDALEAFYSQLSGQGILSSLTSRLGSTLSTVFTAVSSTAGAVATAVMALVFMLYLLLDKERLARQASQLLTAFLPARISGPVFHAASLLNEIYANFFGKQCLEAVILGGLMWLAFMVFGLPYAGLVAVMTAVLSLVPYVGSFLSCAVGAGLILMISPEKALISILVYQAVQFVENQFIYPRVVGGAVGLPPFWTIFAVFLGGKLFGVPGMIFFIPFTATVYILVREAVTRRRGRAQPAPQKVRARKLRPPR